MDLQLFSLVIFSSCLASADFIFPGAWSSTTDSSRTALRFGQRISKTKCDEYKELIVEKIPFGGLGLESTPFVLNRTRCESVDGLVIGGRDADPGEFPHMAAIGYPNRDRGYSFSCGGSLISNLYVLTVAHCEKIGDGVARIVRLGNTNQKVKESGEISIPVAEFIAHEDFEPTTLQNDIALIKLRRPVILTKILRPACLHQGDSGSVINHAMATGWGFTSNEGHRKDILQKVVLDTIEIEKCRKAFKKSLITVTISPSQICAGTEDGRDTCGGDSGGPLQTTIGNNCVYNIIGITSFGSIHCGQKGSPGVYVRVSSYLDWIEPKVWG